MLTDGAARAVVAAVAAAPLRALRVASLSMVGARLTEDGAAALFALAARGGSGGGARCARELASDR